jgi:hypothetical protein
MPSARKRGRWSTMTVSAAATPSNQKSARKTAVLAGDDV